MMCLVNPLSHIAPYFIIFCLTPDDFTCQGGESSHVLHSPGLKLFCLKLSQSLIIYKMHLQYKTNKSWKPVIQNNTELPAEEAKIEYDL
jgi:hypothetical protein